MIEKLKNDLDVNYHSEDDGVITELVNFFSVIASHHSNRKSDDEELEPYIYEAVKSAYLRRGDEGSTGSNTGGMSSSYIDIVAKLRADVLAIRKGNF